jgi:TIR domain
MSVYISHSRRNGGAALKLYEKLEARGVKTWLDLREIEADSDWNQRVADAIRGASGFVFLIGPGPSSGQSQRYEWQVITEEEYYLDPEKPLIPILLGESEIPGFLKTRQAIRISESSIDFDALADKVAHAVKQPHETIDQENLVKGREARQRSMKDLEDYSRVQQEEDAKRAPLRSMK